MSERSSSLRTVARGVRPVLGMLLALLGVAAAAAYPPWEYALRRPADALIFIDTNGDSVPDRTYAYGVPSDVALSGDFDGDTLTDFAVYRDGTWYIDFFNDAVADRILIFGGSTAIDTPLVGDFNADGKADIGVYRNTGEWYLDYNQDGVPDHISAFGGGAQDIPVLADFDADGAADRAIYRQGLWYVDLGLNGSLDAIYAFGGVAGDVPLAFDYSHDGVADLVIFRDGIWYLDTDRNGTADVTRWYGAPGDKPHPGFYNTANSVFVNAVASGTQNGQQKTPYKTIAAALSASPAPGTTIRVAAGNYAERVSVSSKSGLTFQGAGPKATHVVPAAGDAFTTYLCPSTTLRDLRCAAAAADGTTPGRGIAILGSEVTLESVSTLDNYHHNVIAVDYLGTLSTVTADRCNFSRSAIGNGVELEGGVTLNLSRSTVNANGTDPAHVLANGGRGVVFTDDSNGTIAFCHVNANYDGGVLVTHTSAAYLDYNLISANGTNGAYYELQSVGGVTGNTFSGNGTRGARGPTGYNGLELNWDGTAPMTIQGNTFSSNTLNGIYAGGGAASILDNSFVDNYLGVTVCNTTGSGTNVTLKGNLFDLSPGTPYSEGVFMQPLTAVPMVIAIGGTPAAEKNTFQDFGSWPAIHCSDATVNCTCPSGGNVFVNCSLPVQTCTNCLTKE